MIKPTIFVGLGTTGTNILKTLRQLMSEEYKESGLPIFRYISIETKDTETGDNSKKFKDYEQIKVVNATIDETAPIRNQLNPTQPYHNSHLAEWINPDLLNQIQSFKEGASNIRMAGRLCLWENWKRIWSTLSAAQLYVIEDKNRQATSKILTQHYEAKDLDVPVQLVDDNGINVYVVGTLCGGTCSGMLIDMAYLIRNLIGIGGANEVNGIFTMYDQLSAGSSEDDTATRAANCYASLSELNYYNHTKTMYEVTFPNGIRVNTLQKPYDYELLVSATSKQPAIKFVSGGKVDEKGLSLMVALNLFAEAAGDTDGHKKEIRTDWVGFGAGYGGLKPVPTGEIQTMVKCLASFGLTAVWYPKYRIASAAACFASMELCKKLKNRHDSDEDSRADAINEWNRIRNNANILTNPQVAGQPSLMNEIEAHLNNLQNEVLNQKLSAQNLEGKLNSYPGSDAGSFANRFSQNGTYYAWIEGKVDNCKDAFRAAIDRALQNQLSKVFDSPSTYGINDVQRFFEELDSVIKATQGRIKNELPTLNLGKLNFEPMKRAEKNPWTKALGNREEAVSSHRESLIREYRQLIIGDGMGIYHKMRYYFLRQVLDDVRAKLGFEGSSATDTVKQQLDAIQSNLDLCIQTLNEEYNSNIQPPGYECVKIVANNPQNSIQIDADNLGNQIVGESINDDMRVEDGQPIEKDEFLKKGDEYLSQQMSETYRRSALNKINVGSEDGGASTLVVTKAQNLLEHAGDDIRNLARRSNPYQEFSPMYKPIAFNLGTKIVFGHDPTGQRLDALKNSLEFERIGRSSVDHLLFFYEEEAGFTFDDLAVYELLENHFKSSLAPYGHWTHQNPNFYDLKLQPKGAELKRWCLALANLVPKIKESHPEAFNSVFKFQNGGIIFAYRNKQNVDQFLALSADNATGIDKLCSVENDTYYNSFFDSIKEKFNKLGHQKATDAVNELLEQIIDTSEKNNMGEFYTQFLEEIFPDGGGTTVVPPGSEQEVAPTSSKDTPQTSQDIVNEEQSETPIEQGTELTADKLKRIQEVLNTPTREWTQEDHTLMAGFTFGDISRINEVLDKPPIKWTPEDHILMQRIHQNFESIDSEQTSTTQETSTDQSEGVTFEEVDPDEKNNL